MPETSLLLDVREDIRSGREPFSKIMNAAAGLRPGQDLRLVVPFEPVPLVNILNKQGFRHTARCKSPGEWEVVFVRDQAQAVAEPVSPRPESPLPANEPATEILDVDARGLEPPMPMVKILEALSALSPGGQLRGHTDRRPLHLYAQLESRGFVGQTVEQPDGSFITYIRHQGYVPSTH
jgi:uncharacterized protein (DUF2249 family)